MKKIIFGTSLLFLWACNNGEKTNTTTTPSADAPKTPKFEAIYQQAAQEACACMTKLDSLNTKRQTYKMNGNGDSLMRMIPEMKTNAVTVWKCFEAKLSGLGALDRAKLDEALDAFCPTWANLKRDSLITPTH
jgi:hypothetical protein